MSDMPTSMEKDKENERKEKRVSLDSPSTFLSPASRVAHKKARVSVPLVLKSNDLAAGDVTRCESEEAASFPSASVTPVKASVDEAGPKTASNDEDLTQLTEEQSSASLSTPTRPPEPRSTEIADVNELAETKYVPLVGDPFLDATAADTTILDRSAGLSISMRSTLLSGCEDTSTDQVILPEDPVLDATAIDAGVLDETVDGSTPIRAVLSDGDQGSSATTETVEAIGSDGASVEGHYDVGPPIRCPDDVCVNETKESTEVEKGTVSSSISDETVEQDSSETAGAESRSCSDETVVCKDSIGGGATTTVIGSCESTRNIARVLSEKKRRVRASLMEPPSTPLALMSYARDRIDDYSFRINEAYCDDSQLCDNCYALRVELENITEKLSTLYAEHEKCKLAHDIGQSSLECVDQLKAELGSVSDELVRLTSENAQLKQTAADMEVTKSALAELQKCRVEERAQLEQLRDINMKLTTKNANLAKDLDDYKFVMEREMKKWKNEADNLKKKIFDLEGSLEDSKEAVQEVRMQLKAEYDANLLAKTHSVKQEVVDAEALDENTTAQMDKLKQEFLTRSNRLTDEQSKNDRAGTKPGDASSSDQEVLDEVFALEENELDAQECILRERKVEELEGKLAEAIENAEMARKENEDVEQLKHKVLKLELQLAEFGKQAGGDAICFAEKVNDERLELEKERDELSAKLAALESELQGESEAKEIIQDALRESEAVKNELAEQLVKMEESSTHEISQLRKHIRELEQQLTKQGMVEGEAHHVTNEKLALTSKPEEYEVQSKKLHSELERLTAENGRLVEVNEQKEQLLGELRKERDVIFLRLAQQESATSEYLQNESRQKAILEKEMNSLREQLSNIVQRTAATVSEVVRLEFERESKEKGGEIERLNGLKKEMEEELDGMRAKMREMESECNSRESKCRLLEQELKMAHKVAEDLRTTLQNQLSDVKADFERSLQANTSEWENRVAHWRGLSEVKDSLLDGLVSSMKNQAAELIKVMAEEEVGWLKKRAAQSDAELASLKEELNRTQQQLRDEYSIAREKEEQLLAIRMEANSLKTTMENVSAEKEVLKCKLEEATTQLTKMCDWWKVTEERNERIHKLEAELLYARASEVRLTKEMATQKEEILTLKEQIRAADEKLDLERKQSSTRMEQLQKQSDGWKRELEALKVKSELSTSLENELNAVRAEREAVIMNMKIELSESVARYDSTKSALDKATRRVKDLEQQLAEKPVTLEPLQDAFSSKQISEENEEMRRRIAMLERENDRMGIACDEADDEIKTLREEVIELKEKIAIMEGLGEEEVARRLGTIGPFVPRVIEETVKSVGSEQSTDAGADTSEKAMERNGSSRSKVRSPWKKTKSPKEEATGEQQSCRTQ